MDHITSELGEEYQRWKDAEKAKNALKEKFFRAATETLKEQIPPQKMETIEAEDEEDALRRAQRQFPRHRVLSVRDDGNNKWDLVLEENPELREFSYVNDEDGKIYRRIIAEGTPFLDDEGMKDEEPGLWEAITEEVTTRKLKPLDQLTPEQAAAVRKYITVPAPQARLGAPRKAKEEEIDGPYNDG